MFAPLIAKAQVKKAESSTNKPARQGPTLDARSFAGTSVEDAQTLDPSIDDHARSQVWSQMDWGPSGSETGDPPASYTEGVLASDRAAAIGVSWDFSKVPLFPPDRKSKPQARSSRPTSPRPVTTGPKLVAGQVNDPLERQADRAADQVDTPISRGSLVGLAPRLSRKCASCEEEEEVQTLHKKPAGTPKAAVGKAPGMVHAVLRAPGQPLDAATRAYFEPRFGYDFSRVRVHTDTAAAESAQAVNALAYTVGSHMVFARREYAPNSRQGQKLLAHELTHVVQQEGSAGRMDRLTVDAPDSSAEREASAVADKVAAGGHARVSRASGGPVIRRAGCEELFKQNLTLKPDDFVDGTEAHKVIGADFAAQNAGNAISLNDIPGASASPLKTDSLPGKKGSAIPPEVVDPNITKRTKTGGDISPFGQGRADLVFKDGRTAELAEIKPANPVMVAEGMGQLVRYIDQLNQDDARMVAYKRGKGIDHFTIMAPKRYAPRPDLKVGTRPITVRWCAPGSVAYHPARDDNPEVFLCEALSDQGRVDRYIDGILVRAQAKVDEFIDQKIDAFLNKALGAATLHDAIGKLYHVARGLIIEKFGIPGRLVEGLPDEQVVDAIVRYIESNVGASGELIIRNLILSLKKELLDGIRTQIKAALRQTLQQGLNALCAGVAVLSADKLLEWLNEQMKRLAEQALAEAAVALVAQALKEAGKAVADALIAVGVVALIILSLPEDLLAGAAAGIAAAIAAIGEAIAGLIETAGPAILRFLSTTLPALGTADAGTPTPETGTGSIAAPQITTPDTSTATA
jgi:Domain of unknown function (DUF4157)